MGKGKAKAKAKAGAKSKASGKAKKASFCRTSRKIARSLKKRLLAKNAAGSGGGAPQPQPAGQTTHAVPSPPQDVPELAEVGHDGSALGALLYKLRAQGVPEELLPPQLPRGTKSYTVKSESGETLKKSTKCASSRPPARHHRSAGSENSET